jgi:type VI protein secretion system component VasK
VWWPRILADYVLSPQAQAQAASQTYDKPVNWWLAWGVIGLTTFAAGVIAWIFWQLTRQDKQLESVRDQEMAFLRQDVVGGLSEVKKALTEVKELLLRRRGGG